MFLDGSPPDFLAHQISMEAVMAVLTDKKQALVRPIALAGMTTHRASLGGIMGIHLDGHTLVQEGFVSNGSMQLSKTPTGLSRIGTTLLLTRLFAMLASCTLTDVCQVLQPDQ